MEVHREWTTINKKKNKEDYGIAVTCTVSRINRKILKMKIEKQYSDIQVKEQVGFQAGSSTVDHLFCVRQLIEKKVICNQNIP